MPLPLAQAEQILQQASNGMFDIEECDINGIPTKVWKSAPENLRTILESTRQFFDRDYLVYHDERYTYQAHYQKVAQLAYLLKSKYGIEKGDRVALAMRNLPEWPMIFWATVISGAIIVPLNAWWKGEELTYGLHDSGAKLLFADQERLAELIDHQQELTALKHIVAVRQTQEMPIHAERWEDLFSGTDPEQHLPNIPIPPDTPCTLFYTSGTTGHPKGALGTHRNICNNLLSGVFVRYRTEIRYGRKPEPAQEQLAQLISVPLFHATGCHAILCGSTFAGSKLVFMHKWDPEVAMELIEKEKITSFGGVPSMVWQVLESPRFPYYDLSSLQTIGYGGAPSAPELQKRVQSEFPHIKASNGYGLTETSALTTSNNADDYIAKPDSVGTPPPVTSVKIMNAEEKELPPGEIGEVWIFGPQVVTGYWNKPEATSISFTNGWLHSGDLGYKDEEGFLYIVDRAKDMLIRGGENIYCVEVENALYDHPDIMDAAVVGIPDHILGEEVGAMVQVRENSTVTEDELKAHVERHLAHFKVPKKITLDFVPLPRNANGKIMKNKVKELMGLIND